MRVYWTTLPRAVKETDELATRYTKRTNKTEGIKRHYNAASYVHWKVFQSYDNKTTENGNKWYKREPETVVENEYATVFVQYANSY